jgi:hypothetical protein
MKLIESKTLGTAAASIEFTSIPQTPFTDLVALISYRTDRAQVFDQLRIQFNDDTGANYSFRGLTGDGAGANSESTSGSGIKIAPGVGASATANTFSNNSLYISNYSGSTNKSVSSDAVGENNATTAYQSIFAGLWSNTAGITKIKFFPEVGPNFVIGSTISLYGITKGSDGIVTTS